MQVTGGGLSTTAWAIIGGIVSFIISMAEGFINPTKCGK